MAEEPTTTGTPGQEGGDAVAAGTPAPEGRDAEGKEPDYKALFLASKSKLEEANRILRESKEEPEPSPAAAGTADLSRVDWSVVEYHAKRGDEVAKAQLLVRDTLVQNEIRSQLSEIHDPAEREATRKHFLANTHRLGDVSAALKEVREPRLAEENQKLREALAKATQPAKPQVGGPPIIRDVPAVEYKDRMTKREWDAEQKTLPRFEAMKRQRLLNEGKISVDD